MSFKVAIFACIVAVVYSQAPLNPSPTSSFLFQNDLGLSPNPINLPLLKLDPYRDGNYEPAQYQFQYEVNAQETGDEKSQQEERLNNAIKGSYSFVQPDGLLRVVTYFDNGNGFVASVRYEPTSVRIPQPPPIIPVAKISSVEPLQDSEPIHILASFNGRFL